ncbi:MAG: hypothetical protein HWE26_22475 [Alteromonadaceae bacterium]|nr:hypothetical protein [Alteromonadaceae bacterium]
MFTTRLATSSTTANASSVIALLHDDRTERVTFFATETKATDQFHREHGTDGNLPLVAILAEGRMLGPVKLFVVGDSVDFLMATRQPRSGEVKDVTDAAVKSGKAYFSRVRAPFTSHLTAEEAAETLRRLETVELTAATVAEYRAMLSNVPDAWQ